jgi:hypothetical protein
MKLKKTQCWTSSARSYSAEGCAAHDGGQAGPAGTARTGALRGGHLAPGDDGGTTRDGSSVPRGSEGGVGRSLRGRSSCEAARGVVARRRFEPGRRSNGGRGPA